MEKIRIQNCYLRDGELELHGYKHAMVQIISASIALNVPVVIMNAPLVDDTLVLQEIIEKSGGSCTVEGHRLSLDPRGITNTTIDPELSSKIHGSLYLLPAFAVRFGHVNFCEAGGCQIGSSKNNGKRPVSHILDVMRRFGIGMRYQGGAIIGERVSHMDRVVMDMMRYSESQETSTAPMISGATKTALLCSVATQKTTLLHPYLKTDVQDLVRFLRECGYQISISAQSIEIVAPVSQPTSHVQFYLTECVSEIVTYIALAVHTHITLTLRVSNIELIKNGLKCELDILKKMKINITYQNDKIIINKNHAIHSVDIDVTNDTIQSDHHPFFALMLLQGHRQARIREFVWQDRFAYVKELTKLGAELKQEGNTLYIHPSHLTQSNQVLYASDTRAAAILILASLTAPPPIEIENIHHLHRGYENLLEAIQSLGVELIQGAALV